MPRIRGVQMASTCQKSCEMHRDFAREFVKRWFGDDVAEVIYAYMPVYSRGPRKGLAKGYVHWTKVEEGGWGRIGDGRRGVMKPGTHGVRIGSRDPFALCLRTRDWYTPMSDSDWMKLVAQIVSEIGSGRRA